MMNTQLPRACRLCSGHLWVLRPGGFLLWIILVLLPGMVAAQSIDPGASINFSISATSFPRNAAVGTRDNPAGTLVGTRYDNITCSVTKTSTVAGTLVSGYTDVYRTSNPGIGVRLEYSAALLGSYTSAPRTETYNTNAPSGTVQFFRRAVLVIVGPVATGMLTSLPSLTVTFGPGPNCTPANTFSTVSTTMTLTGAVITGQTCSVTTPSVGVTLPPVSQSDLIPAGTTAGNKAFAIGLNCTAGTNVYVTLTDATDNSNRTSLLKLGPSSTARGVQLRILRNGTTPVLFGADSAVAGNVNQFLVGASSSVTSVNLTAQYISTGTVAPGSVNAAATFTMSYQ